MKWIMRLFNLNFFTPDVPVIGCLLPPPKVREKAPKPAQQGDGYWIDEQTRTMGFRTATAINQQDGAVQHLTDFDIEELKARDSWGTEKTARGHKNKRGIKTNLDNQKAKAAWYTGGNAAEIAKAVGLGDSWAEKRHGAFEAALRQENIS
jgi:hypothetical protein